MKAAKKKAAEEEEHLIAEALAEKKAAEAAEAAEKLTVQVARRAEVEKAVAAAREVGFRTSLIAISVCIKK